MFKGKPVLCPFCQSPVAPPQNLGFQYSDFDAGFCECGAVYVSDVTGFNRGAAFVEALLLACGGDWDLAWELVPEEDYEERVLEHYDQKLHLLFHEDPERPAQGVLYFLRLADDVRGISRENLEEIRKQRKRSQPPADFRPRRLSRQEAERLLREGKRRELLLLSRYQPLNLRVLQKLLYSADLELRWQAVMLLGEAAYEVLAERPEIVADLVKRLIYASADSAASAWGALETVGEIIRRAPERFGLFVKNLFAFLKYPEFRPAALFALGRIGEAQPQLIRREPALKLLEFLKDEDPETRAQAAWAVGKIGLFEAQPALSSLLEDRSPVTLFEPEEGKVLETTVGEVAQKALHLLSRGKDA